SCRSRSSSSLSLFFSRMFHVRVSSATAALFTVTMLLITHLAEAICSLSSPSSPSRLLFTTSRALDSIDRREDSVRLRELTGRPVPLGLPLGFGDGAPFFHFLRFFKLFSFL